MSNADGGRRILSPCYVDVEILYLIPSTIVFVEPRDGQEEKMA